MKFSIPSFRTFTTDADTLKSNCRALDWFLNTFHTKRSAIPFVHRLKYDIMNGYGDIVIFNIHILTTLTLACRQIDGSFV